MANERKVESRGASLFEHRHVRIIGHVLVDFVSQRRSGSMRRRLRENLHQAPVARAGFKHLRFPGIAAGFDVDRDSHILSRGIFCDERRRPKQAVFFAIGDHKKNVIAKRRPGAQSAKRFEQCSHSCAVVSRAGARGYGVVVRHQSNRITGAARSFHPRHNVFDCARHFVARRDASGFLNLGCQAERGKLRHEIIAHAIVLRRANRMRRRRKSIQINESALGGETFLRCTCRQRIRSSLAHDAHARNKQHEQQNDPAPQAFFHGIALAATLTRR